MAKVPLPKGYRFHPTDEELMMCYLKRKVMGRRLPSEAVSEIKLYEYAPWEFRGMSESKDLEWFFFCSPDRKYTTGSRRNRVTKNGFWKVTGNYKNISCGSRVVGKRKTLVFHEGKAPKGDRTNWVMHEYWLEDKKLAEADASICQDRFVVCKIFEKSGLGPKNGEQYGAPFEEEADDDSDGDSGDDVSGSLMPHPVAIPRSSSLLLGEGQDASMISSALDSGNGQNSFPHYFEAPNVSAHPSLEHDVHSLLLNVPDEDGDTSNRNNVQQADSICLNKSTVEDVEIFNGLEDLESIKKYLEDENMWHQTFSRFSEGSFLEMNDLQMPTEVDYLEWNDLRPIEAFVSNPGISANVGPHSTPVLAAPKVMDGSSECNLGCMEATSDSARLHKKGEIRGLHANHSLARGKRIKVLLSWECVCIGGGDRCQMGMFSLVLFLLVLLQLKGTHPLLNASITGAAGVHAVLISRMSYCHMLHYTMQVRCNGLYLVASSSSISFIGFVVFLWRRLFVLPAGAKLGRCLLGELLMELYDNFFVCILRVFDYVVDL